MKIPLVCIVGRPNVGKSTLFNRLTKSNSAIVDDESGVTRDRNYGEVEWNGKYFKLTDTGGYVPDSSEVFDSAIREQVKFAVSESDAIIFMADGNDGILPTDYEIAKLLRVSSKPTFVLVNKLDTAQKGYLKTDFYSLGLEHVYDIAAISGRNLGDFLDVLVETLNIPIGPYEIDERLKIAVVGRPNVGKSSLTNALLGFDRSIVTDIPGTTRDSIDSVLKYYGEEIVLLDTAGLRKKAKIQEDIEYYSNVRTYRALMESDVAIVLLDVERGLESQDQKIIQEAVRRRKGLIIAVNKWDLLEKDTKTAQIYEKELKYDLGSVDYAQIIFVSALTKQRIYKLIDLAKEINIERKKKIDKTELNEVLLAEFLKSPPPATQFGKEVKIRYINQVGDNYPIFLLFADQADHIGDNYRKFVERTIRKHFGFKGVPITVSFRDK
ncbi:MAG: ribosome biogenesis GTPase Der [bacterium]